MNLNISEETIEIGGKEYKLFLNRKAIINWERMTKVTELSNKYQNFIKENTESGSEEINITDDTNPFEMYGNVEEELDNALNEMQEVYAKFYWVALYQNHKFTLKQATELFNQAVEEYGIEQLVQLATQMLENANKDMVGKSTKNLKALKSTKN